MKPIQWMLDQFFDGERRALYELRALAESYGERLRGQEQIYAQRVNELQREIYALKRERAAESPSEKSES